DQHLTDNVPIALHRGGEPAQVEDVRQVGDRGAPTQQYKAARPRLLEFTAFEELASRLCRTLHQQLAVEKPRSNHELSAPVFGDRWQRRFAKRSHFVAASRALSPSFLAMRTRSSADAPEEPVRWRRANSPGSAGIAKNLAIRQRLASPVSIALGWTAAGPFAAGALT